MPTRQITAMRDSIMHRGPDGAGCFQAPGVALGSRRLAILDLSDRGHMPMSSPDQRYWITYNGEVYNYRELRRSLESAGHSFRSDTDTEVVLSLYRAEGPAMLSRLNGMFAFGIWDSQERTLFLARDRLGVKPLYYAWHGGDFYFASEEKALFAAGVPRAFDHNCWPELLSYRYVAGEKTPFKEVRRLLPGHWLRLQRGSTTITQWWSLSDRVRSLRSSPPEDAVGSYRETFDDAVEQRRISDVPVGVLLSGGLDSGSVAASLSSQGQAGQRIASFTVRFSGPGYDEGPLAAQVAQKWGLDPHYLEVPPTDLLSRLRHAAWLNDEPLAHGNDLHLLAISLCAKASVSVLLSGEGADETLGGYVRYRPLRYSTALRLAGWCPWMSRVPRLPSRWRKFSRMAATGGIAGFVRYNACDLFPEDLSAVGLGDSVNSSYREQILREATDLYPGEPLRQAMYSDQHTFLCSVLDRNDRMTMGASIECRVPFLDYRLVELTASLPTRVLMRGHGSKPLLRGGLGDRLPTDVLRHKKWGFGVPWSSYLRTVPDLHEAVVNLHRRPLVLDSPLDHAAVRRACTEFLSGQDRWFPLVMQLLMISQCGESVGGSRSVPQDRGEVSGSPADGANRILPGTGGSVEAAGVAS